MTADEVAEQIKNAIISSEKRVVMNYLISQASFFSLPIVNPIVGFLVEKVFEIAVKYGELLAYGLYIDHVTAEQAAKFADLELKKQNLKTDEEKAANEKAIIDAARALIKFSH